MKRLLKAAAALAAGSALLAAAVLAADWWMCLPPGLSPRYVGRHRCAACHPGQLQQWAGSDHDRAMDLATEQTVLGDFNDRRLTHFGLTSRMFRQDGRFFVSTEGPDGKMHTYPIKYTLGVRPLQQYMVQFPKGRVQVLPIAWDTQKKRWFHLYPNERIAPDDWLHWTRPAQRWNDMCADCHSTDLRKNYDRRTGTYRTTWSEIDVSCEACHGPGSIHVKLAESRGLFWDRRYGTGLARLKGQGSKTELEACARCHSRRRQMADGFKPGDDFYDYYGLSLLDQGLYHADGQIIEEVYVFGSFLQSRMYREGVRCTDCHDPHTLRLRAVGNKLCTQCHLPGLYDTPAHHHHKPGTNAAACVECHMPSRTYMVVDPRRDHGLKVPRPDLTVRVGVPNVCNRCHTDQTAEWARDQVVQWYGGRRPDDPHFAPILAAARRHDPKAQAGLARLTARTDVGPIVRATAAFLLGQYRSRQGLEALKAALADPYPLVRFAAVRALDGYSDAEDLVQSLAPVLNDPVRLVRSEAARVLAPVRRRLPPGSASAFASALDQFKQGQWLANDQASYHNLGNLYEQLGNDGKAMTAYHRALEIDARFVPTRFNLAMLYYRRGNRAAAERMYREIIKLEPESADAYYSLGLLVAEEPQRLAEAAQCLARAAALAPDRPRIQYNYGLALQRLGRLDKAQAALVAAAKLDPHCPDFLYAVAQLYAQRGLWQKAQAWAEYLVQAEPDNPNWMRLATEMRQRAKQASDGDRERRRNQD